MGEARERFASEQEYLHVAEARGTLPEGFTSATTALSFTPAERPTEEPYRMELGMLCADAATESWAGVFTRNAFPGAPVRIARRRLGKPLRALVVNNRIANVCTAHGEQDAATIAERAAGELGCSAEEVLTVSTGIIGWRLPVEEISAALPGLVQSRAGGSALSFAKAIMTTDAFPKVRSVPCGEGSIVGVAKGAGMIEPNMATMLAFLTTDVDIDNAVLGRALTEASERTFNRISVDGDQSTSDMVLAVSSRRAGPCGEEELTRALTAICGELAEDIVRNGEGTAHVIRVEVAGARSEAEAAALGKAVINSPLVKTAIFGNDPNVGRIVAAVGDFAGNAEIPIDSGTVSVYLGNEVVFSDGVFLLDKEKEIRLSDYLKSKAMNPRLRGYPQHDEIVEMRIELGSGSGRAHVIGSDLSNEYVHENADYRS